MKYSVQAENELDASGAKNNMIFFQTTFQNSYGSGNLMSIPIMKQF